MEKSKFYNNLKQLIDESGCSFNQVERELGYPRNALHNYKCRTEPSAIRLLELSSYFSVSPERLLGVDDLCTNVSIRSLFNHLNDKEKKEVYILCQDWLINNIIKE